MKFQIPLFFSKAELVDAGRGYRENSFVRFVKRSNERLKKNLSAYGYKPDDLAVGVDGTNAKNREPQMESKR